MLIDCANTLAPRLCNSFWVLATFFVIFVTIAWLTIPKREKR